MGTINFLFVSLLKWRHCHLDFWKFCRV